MKRDMELIRKIALTIEAAPTGFAPDLKFDGYTPEEIGYHAYLMIDGGLATGPTVTHARSTGPEAKITALTSKGHDFAEAARDETRWKKVMIIVQEKGGSITLPVLAELLKMSMRSAFGLQ